MIQKKSLLIRMDARLAKVLEKWAADEFRSLNAQIEYLLTDAARKTGRLKKGEESEEGSRKS